MLAARKTDKLLFFFKSHTDTHTLDWPWIIRLVCSGLFLCLISPPVTVRSVNKLDVLPDRHLGLQISIRSCLLSFILYLTVITGCCMHAAASNQNTLFLSHLRATFRSYFFSSFSHPSQRDSSKNTGRCVQELTCDVASVEQELVDSTAKRLTRCKFIPFLLQSDKSTPAVLLGPNREGHSLYVTKYQNKAF